MKKLHSERKGLKCLHQNTGNRTMQQMWTEIDAYIDSHLIPEDPILLHALQNTEDRGYPDHLAVAPNQGMLLQMLIQMNHCKRVLELGTFAAYSTLWLARALPDDGYILTIEGREAHAIVAKENIEHAQLKPTIELQVGRAAELLKALPDDTEAFDFIFIDADKVNNPRYLEWAIQLSREGTVIVGDNVVRGGGVIDSDSNDPNVQGLREFIQMISEDERLEATAIQTVGEKGWDGFIMAIVKAI